MNPRDAGGKWRALSAAGIALLCCLLVPAAVAAFDPELEAKNFAKTEERMQYVTLTPEFQARLTQANVDNAAEAAQIPIEDPERNFAGNVCANGGQECAGDVRFYDWKDNGFGIVEPVLFTARNGSTISGRVWATEGGPEQRPLIVITTGSVQAPERLYWGQAAVLANHGYVVLTYDVQGQGRSDTFGAGVDQMDGVPSQEGRPFYDNTEDALDFALSTESDPYDPRPSCTSGTDHSDKQDRRVEEGFNAAFNPLADLVDPSRVGIAGHSLGAAGVSYIGQIDDRVDAIVAWDNLRAPDGGQDPGEGPGGPPECESGSSPRPPSPPITKPAMGISNDYGIAPSPNTADPDPQSGNEGFLAYKEAGVDSLQFHIRGGTHEESAFIPGMTVPILGLATLRGPDLVGWYSTAWFDMHVRCAAGSECEQEADRRLLTDRWRNDLRSGQIDTNDDPNVFSFYKRSRYDFRTAEGDRVVCDDMRAGCESMGPDGLPAGYDLVADAYTPRAEDGPGPGGPGGGGSTPACGLAQRGSAEADTPATLPPSAAGDAIRGGGGNDRLRGGDGDDCLYGANGRDRLKGEGGRDRLKGGSGRDRLVGGPGRDRLGGGPGADVLRSKGGGRDKVKCGPGDDRVIAGARDRLGRGCPGGRG